MLVPVWPVRQEIVRHCIVVVVGIVASPLVHRFFQVTLAFLHAVRANEGTRRIVGRDIVPLGNFPGLLEAGKGLFNVTDEPVGVGQVVPRRRIARVRRHEEFVGLQCLGQIELLQRIL